jgi:hypothetical protein
MPSSQCGEYTLSALAEISDKMPTFAGTTVAGCVIGLLALVLGLLRPWLCLLPLPLVLFCDWALWAEIQEPVFGELVIRELGREWIAGQFVGWNLPYVIAVTATLGIVRKRWAAWCKMQCGREWTGVRELVIP